MTLLEKQIIQIIQTNKYLSENLKRQYILSMFLMEADKQKEYFQLLKAFGRRCGQMDRGTFTLKPEEKERVMKTYEQVKEDLLNKIEANEHLDI